MENPDFESVIASYLLDQVGISSHFLSEALSAALLSNLVHLYTADQLHSAGTGNRHNYAPGVKFRTDKIHWLNRSGTDVSEKQFFDRMDQFIQYLNQTCYTGITDCEFHYTVYEAGSFYKPHIDQFHNDNRRVFSMIHYLNTNWQKQDGGELCLHHTKGDQLISPDMGKSVFFDSNAIVHEVMTTQQKRYSITGWLKKS